MGQLFLIGYMGVGKSTIGRILAERLQRPFEDLDDRIQERVGMAIREYFDNYGESAFRRTEKELLEELATCRPAVIACGGGTPCYESNLSIMQEHGTLIHLKADPGLLSSRLKGESRERPKLAGSDEKRIREQLRKREAYYHMADLTVKVEAEEPEKNAARILELYYSR